jgi:hypothetical protein
MTSRDFVIWLKGFTEACNDYTATPKQWDRIKEVLYEVEDYDDNPGIDAEVDGWDDWYQRSPQTGINLPLSGSITSTQCHAPTITFSSGSSATHITATVWNDQMGNWHYTNYPEGTGGYYHRPDNKKQQLND